MEACYPGQLPRNEEQVSNYKRLVPVKLGQGVSVQSDANDLYTVMLRAHLEGGREKFIRDVKAYPELAIVLACDQQLRDLERFCFPHGICLQHEEWHTFTPQGSNTCQSRFANVYYHCSVACVMVVWPSFIPSSIVVPVEVQSRLLPEHKQWLYASFGVYVP